MKGVDNRLGNERKRHKGINRQFPPPFFSIPPCNQVYGAFTKKTFTRPIYPDPPKSQQTGISRVKSLLEREIVRLGSCLDEATSPVVPTIATVTIPYRYPDQSTYSSSFYRFLHASTVFTGIHFHVFPISLSRLETELYFIEP